MITHDDTHTNVSPTDQLTIEVPADTEQPETPETPQAPEAPTTPEASDTPDADAQRPLSEVINERATEDESALNGDFKLSNILAGEMFNASSLRKQVKLILLIAFFIILNVGNRYGCQQRLIKIDQLEKNLQDMRFRQLSNASRLTQECRQSNVMEKLQQSNNTTLHIPNQPPYLITVPAQ